MVPTMSDGSRSGVNWMRWNFARIAAASVLTAYVLARPGTPSIRMWPFASRPTSMRWTRYCWPTMAFETSAVMVWTSTLSRSMRSLTALISSVWIDISSSEPMTPKASRSVSRAEKTRDTVATRGRCQKRPGLAMSTGTRDSIQPTRVRVKRGQNPRGTAGRDGTTSGPTASRARRLASFGRVRRRARRGRRDDSFSTRPLRRERHEPRGQAWRPCLRSVHAVRHFHIRDAVALRLERIAERAVCRKYRRCAAAERAVRLGGPHFEPEANVAPRAGGHLRREPFPGRRVRSFRPTPVGPALRQHVAEQSWPLERDVRGREPASARSGDDDPPWVVRHVPSVSRPGQELIRKKVHE